MKLTYYGHSCFSIEVNKKHLLFDPFITGNPLATNIDVNTIKADYILLSHAHGDHIADVEVIAERTGALIISNYEIVTHYEKKGFKGHGMGFGGSWTFDFGKITLVHAIHTSSFPDGSYGGVAGGFILSQGGTTIYYSGDTSVFGDMELFGRQYLIDWAILPIGDNFTMGAGDAAFATGLLGCNYVVGVHYDTFPPIKIDKKQAQAKFKDRGFVLQLPPIGGTVELHVD